MNKQISILVHNRRERWTWLSSWHLLYYMHVTPYLLPGSAPWRSNGVSCPNCRRFVCGRWCGCHVCVRISKCEQRRRPPTGTMDREPSEEYFSQPRSEELRTPCGAYARRDDINVTTEHSIMFLYCPFLNVPTYRARDPVSVTLESVTDIWSEVLHGTRPCKDPIHSSRILGGSGGFGKQNMVALGDTPGYTCQMVQKSAEIKCAKFTSQIRSKAS